MLKSVEKKNSLKLSQFATFFRIPSCDLSVRCANGGIFISSVLGCIWPTPSVHCFLFSFLLDFTTSAFDINTARRSPLHLRLCECIWKFTYYNNNKNCAVINVYVHHPHPLHNAHRCTLISGKKTSPRKWKSKKQKQNEQKRSKRAVWLGICVRFCPGLTHIFLLCNKYI